jgi:hypothetical protein
MSADGVNQGSNGNPACNFPRRVSPQAISYGKDSEMIVNLLHIECILVIGSPADMCSAAKREIHDGAPIITDLISLSGENSLIVMPVFPCSPIITG